jgi:molybdopterin-containing oxidoreductase family membrane subunit
MADGHHAEGHYPGMWVFPQASETTRDVAAKTNAMPKPLVYGLVVSGILLVLGIVGFVIRAATSGFDDHAPWGYYAATFSFVFMITSTAPLAAVAFRITKSHWRRPLTRVSELFGLLGIFNVLMFIPLMMVLPPINNPDAGSHELELRRTLWFEVPIGAPHWWDMLGIIGLALAGLVILWVSMTPDLAEARLTATGFRRSVYRLLSGHWHGTKRQWTYQKAWLAMLGAFYFMLLIFMHFTISTDYAMSMIAGWKDSIFPVVYSLTGFQSSLGLMLVILFILRR